MRPLRAVLVLALLGLAAACAPAGASAANAGSAWDISSSLYSPTNLIRGDSSGRSLFLVEATNIGSESTFGTATITDYLPPGVTPNPSPSGNNYFLRAADDGEGEEYPCEVSSAVVRCTYAVGVHPGERLFLILPVNVSPGAPPLVTNRVTVTGGGAAGASASVQAKVSSEPASFGLQSFANAFLDAGGGIETRAGSHPYQMRISAQFNTNPNEGFGTELPPAGNPRNIIADLPAGVVLNPRSTTTRCREFQLEASGLVDGCPRDSIVGTVHVAIGLLGSAIDGGGFALYNMVPPAGAPAEFAFNAAGAGIYIHLFGRLRSDGDYGLSSDTLDIPQFAQMSGVKVDLWGHPSDSSHDYRRCPHFSEFLNYGEACQASENATPLLTMPSACSGPLKTTLSADSWQQPENYVSESVESVDAAGDPAGVTGCDKLSFSPASETVLSTNQAETGSGLDFNVDMPNNGFNDASSIAESLTKKAVISLPEGVTINPSVGEGLGFCTPSQYDREKTFSVEGEGCPSDSKIGSLHLTTPLLDEGVDGTVYLAQQDNPETSEPGAENPFDTDIALYMVLRNVKRGILVKKPIKVEADPRTGQLVATLDDIPQLPFSHFNFHFKEGARAALISPAACGKYTTVSQFYPSSAPSSPKTATSDFEITKGVNGGPCPPAGIPPFDPGYRAGSVNNNAKSYSPFDMRLLRADGEQDMTKFSSVLPPGVLGKLAGIAKCSDADIAAARGKTGRQEKASPSCPANSEVGHTFAGAGVGDSLTYVPGRLYLGGPYNGDPLSVVSVTPALAGPFDGGTVVVREALTLNPVTAEVEVDGANSDPIPHILKGIVLKVRDLRIHVDRPEFILNPTSCEEASAKATLWGAYRDVFSSADDIPVDLSTRYQAASCASLPFKPHLKLLLKGGTRRGAHPALRAVVKARPHDANIGKATVTLPRSSFLDQGHIRTICTRVQYAANGGSGAGCPKAAQYGYARAWTPLLDEPVEGPVYLRSSNHKLPDLVAALHGLVDVDIVGRIDSYKGGIRSSFESVPDAPVSRFVLRMQGGKKGLVVNSRNLCAHRSRAIARFTGQNGVPENFHPVVKARCSKAARKHHRRHKRHRG